VEPLVMSAHTFEEESFYPSLEEHASSCFGSLMIAQIKSEHRVDRRAAHELAMTLRALADRRCRLSLEAVATMTRGFLEYVMRHIAAEKVLLDTLLVAER
jgi:hemerythrin-like domain-containing protein